MLRNNHGNSFIYILITILVTLVILMSTVFYKIEKSLETAKDSQEYAVRISDYGLQYLFANCIDKSGVFFFY